jgi:hypothetical protein
MHRKDPIIEEIHAVREELARQADYDLYKMFEAARARQAASGRKAVRLPPKKVETFRPPSEILVEGGGAIPAFKTCSSPRTKSSRTSRTAA